MCQRPFNKPQAHFFLQFRRHSVPDRSANHCTIFIHHACTALRANCGFLRLVLAPWLTWSLCKECFHGWCEYRGMLGKLGENSVSTNSNDGWDRGMVKISTMLMENDKVLWKRANLGGYIMWEARFVSSSVQLQAIVMPWRSNFLPVVILTIQHNNLLFQHDNASDVSHCLAKNRILSHGHCGYVILDPYRSEAEEINHPIEYHWGKLFEFTVWLNVTQTVSLCCSQWASEQKILAFL